MGEITSSLITSTGLLFSVICLASVLGTRQSQVSNMLFVWSGLRDFKHQWKLQRCFGCLRLLISEAFEIRVEEILEFDREMNPVWNMWGSCHYIQHIFSSLSNWVQEILELTGRLNAVWNMSGVGLSSKNSSSHYIEIFLRYQ